MTSHMKVLMWMPRGWNVPGGHRVQLQRTAAALEDLGVSVTQCHQEVAPVGYWSIIHGFGLRPSEVRYARDSADRVVISTIYWNRRYRHEPDYMGSWWLTRHRVGLALRTGTAALKGANHGIKMYVSLADRASALAFEGADVLLPNSEGEATAIKEELGVTTRMVVVPNAVDEGLFSLAVRPIAQRTEVVCLGRIEPHKNQLGLIRSLRSSGLTLRIVGAAHPDHPGYAASCRREAGPNVEFSSELLHNSTAFHEMLAGVRVSVLPSWFETTGLSNLEAAATGANVVTTDRGYAREYFKEEAWYCDPALSASILHAVVCAWDHPGHPSLRERIRREFTWATCARITLEAYKMALENGRRN